MKLLAVAALAAAIATSAHAAPAPLRLVALGDSIPRANNCTGCTDYVTLYARALAKAMHRPVDVDNRSAVELSNVPAVGAAELYAKLLTDPSLRKAVAQSDVVLVGIGFNDTPWNRLDDPCNAAPRYPVVAWTKITPSCITRVTADFKQTLDEIMTQIDYLHGCGEMPGVPPCSQRGAKDSLLRVTTVFNSTIGDTVDPSWSSPAAVGPTVNANALFTSAACEVAHFHGGRCADLLHAFNGPTGRAPARRYLGGDYTHLNQRGHTLAATVLARLGYAPLR
jgi:lysophospholipase L1-like esterase